MNGSAELRWTWTAWGVLVVVSSGVLVAVCALATGWPSPAWIGFSVAVPIVATTWWLGHHARTSRHGAPVLATTIVVVGILALIVGLQLAVVVVLGRRPDGGERTIYLLGWLATLAACALVTPVRAHLTGWVRRVVFDDDEPPERVLANLGARLTRAIPLDELLLQVVETLHRTIPVSIVELWTGEGGELTLSASIPDRSSTELRLGTEANAVAARAGAQGNAWLEIWIPEVLADRQSRTVRSIPIQHRGELFGLLVLDRDPELPSFDQREDGMLLELARQLGLALHNARLDAALRATVRELERSNAELTTSRARLVRAADESRRHIERDLHDGAQQRLVGLAIQAGLARAALESDPRTARALLDQLTVDVEDTIVELRELAHGIYPPRLRDRGLVDAIHTMTQRVGLPTTVEADRIERYAQEVEAAVYFCCSEALLNAGKHAGTGSTVAIRLSFADGTLELTVADDGVGFDNASHQGGQGITNMRDRIGALGGELRVDSAPDGGTVVHAMLPALPVTSEEDAGRGTRPAAAE